MHCTVQPCMTEASLRNNSVEPPWAAVKFTAHDSDEQEHPESRKQAECLDHLSATEAHVAFKFEANIRVSLCVNRKQNSWLPSPLTPPSKPPSGY